MSLRAKINHSLSRLEKTYDTYNEITLSKSALLNNFDIFKTLSPGSNVIPVLKSNAYGHGIQQIATILKNRKIPYVAVDGYFECLEIHQFSKQPVLVMGAIPPQNFAHMNFERTSFVVQDLTAIKSLGATKRSVKIHLEIDTGMSRHGIDPSELGTILREIKKYDNIEFDGVMSHLADADNPHDEYTAKQVGTFDNCIEKIYKAGLAPKYIHIAQSAGSTKVQSRYANALRIGFSLYGLNPLQPNDKSIRKLSQLQPVLEFTSTIEKVRTLQPGTTVSYSRLYTAKRSVNIGVLPAGYYEGVPRIFTNTGLVQLGNDYLTVVGRVCMNHTMVALAKASSKSGEKVTIISRNPKSKVSVANICKRHDLFDYELVTRLAPTIRRTIVE